MMNEDSLLPVPPDQPATINSNDERAELDRPRGSSKRGFFRRWTITSSSMRDSRNGRERHSISSEHTRKTSNKRRSNKSRWTLKPMRSSRRKDSPVNTTPRPDDDDDDNNVNSPPITPETVLKAQFQFDSPSSSQQSSDSPVAVGQFPVCAASSETSVNEDDGTPEGANENDFDETSQGGCSDTTAKVKTTARRGSVSNYFHGTSEVTPLPFAQRERGKAPEVTRQVTSSSGTKKKKKKKNKNKYNPHLPHHERYSPSTATTTSVTSTTSTPPAEEEEEKEIDKDERHDRIQLDRWRQRQQQQQQQLRHQQQLQQQQHHRGRLRTAHPPVPMNIIIADRRQTLPPRLGQGKDQPNSQQPLRRSTFSSSFQPYPSLPPPKPSTTEAEAADDKVSGKAALGIADSDQPSSTQPTTAIGSLEEEEEFYERARAMARGGPIIPRYVKDYDPNDYDHMRSLSPPTIDHRLACSQSSFQPYNSSLPQPSTTTTTTTAAAAADAFSGPVLSSDQPLTQPTSVIGSLQEEEEFYERASAMVRGGPIIPQYVKDYDPNDYDHMRSLSPPTIDPRLRWQGFRGIQDEEITVDTRWDQSTIHTRHSNNDDDLNDHDRHDYHGQTYYIADHDDNDYDDDDNDDDDTLDDGTSCSLISRMHYSVITRMTSTKKVPEDPNETIFIPIQDGIKVPLRRCAEVETAIAKKYYDILQCGGCQRDLGVIADAAFLYCSTCRQIRPLFGIIKSIGENHPEEPEYLRFGLGLGMTQETIQKVYSKMHPSSTSSSSAKNNVEASSGATTTKEGGENNIVREASSKQD